MSLWRKQHEVSLTGAQAPRGYSWQRLQLEQPKRLVYKKIIKPLMEKRRRDRIAHCLNQLKYLLTDATSQGHKPLPNSRMDKAALLEMTVERIQTLQSAVATDRAIRSGYVYCASLVQAFLDSETRQQPEAFHPPDSTSSFTCETTPLATSLPSPKPEQISSRSEGALASVGLRCFARSPSPSVPNRVGPQLFWRPWSA